jgi:hypothetical protein
MQAKRLVAARGFTLVVTGPHGESIFKGYASRPEFFTWAQIPNNATFSVIAEFPGDRFCSIVVGVSGQRGRDVGDWLAKLWSHGNDFTAHEDHTGGLFCRTWHE